MDDDPVLVGPVELLIQQAEELFVARTGTHGSGSLAERVGGRPRIGRAWEDGPLTIAGFEAKPNTHFPELSVRGHRWASEAVDGFRGVPVDSSGAKHP